VSQLGVRRTSSLVHDNAMGDKGAVALAGAHRVNARVERVGGVAEDTSRVLV
jgi:hypothetical protein